MLDQILVIVSLTVLVMVSPGPDMVLVLRNTVVSGRRAGLRTSMGILVFSMMLVSASFWVFFVYTLDRPTIRIYRTLSADVNRIFGGLLILLGVRLASTEFIAAPG